MLGGQPSPLCDAHLPANKPSLTDTTAMGKKHKGHPQAVTPSAAQRARGSCSTSLVAVHMRNPMHPQQCRCSQDTSRQRPADTATDGMGNQTSPTLQSAGSVGIQHSAPTASPCYEQAGCQATSVSTQSVSCMHCRPKACVQHCKILAACTGVVMHATAHAVRR